MGHGHITGFVIEQNLQVIQFQLATILVDLPNAQGRTAAFAKLDPRADIRLVIAIGDDDFIARND
ncbi:hypothetical protein D3C87_1725170 [compost metagenome]